MIFSTVSAAEEDELSYDGLTRVEGAGADAVYVLPEADFSTYGQFIVLDPVVAFRRNWQRDVNRAAVGLSGRISNDDMEQIKEDVAELFLDVFSENLESGGLTLAEDPGDDVLILRPAILNLDITAPDPAVGGRSRTYVANAGSATLVIELVDSVTGQILARAVDSRRARSSPTFQWVTPGSNRAEARRVLDTWAGLLVDNLNDGREREDESADA